MNGMNVPFKNNITDSRKSNYASPIVLIERFYLANKLVLSSARVFHKNFLIVACCIFGKLEISTLTPHRFKNETNDTLKLLYLNYNHQQRFLKQKMLLSIMPGNRATVDTNIWSNVVSILRNICNIDKVYPR